VPPVPAHELAFALCCVLHTLASWHCFVL